MSDKCTVAEGRHVEPCDTLRDMTEVGPPPPTKARGIYCWPFTNMKTGERSRTFFGAKSTDAPKGLAFNFCPWCGEKIDAPFVHPASEVAA